MPCQLDDDDDDDDDADDDSFIHCERHADQCFSTSMEVCNMNSSNRDKV